ncbi:hypothetical protein DYH09_26130 [bacterium CPR1]|nr:hypothetical protein [bacterium CPR1]
MRIGTFLGALVLALALLAPVSGQNCPPGSPCNPGPSGPPSGPGGPPPILGPGIENGDGEGAGQDQGQGEEGETEEPVGNFSDWLQNNPDSPLSNLTNQAANDPGLQQVLNGLTPSELTNLGSLLTTYQTAINKYVKDNPRTWDTAPGGVRNFLNTLSGDFYTRGCADMQEQAVNALGPHTGGKNPFTVHPYSWVPGAVRQVGVYGGAPLVMIMVVKGAGAGTALAGPAGTIVGGATGILVAVGTGNTEHNMAAIQSTRNPNLIIVLDPHAVQTGNPESVHGPDHYTGPTGRPELGPPKVPATPTTGGPKPVDRGNVR